MKFIKIITAALCLLIWGQTLFAQPDSSSKKNDSLNAALLSDYSKKLIVVEEQLWLIL